MGDQQAAPGDAKVITLCGSTRFEAEFAEVNQRLTLEGCVVIGRVHLQKIRLADEVYVVDPGGYVGMSTRREIAYAQSLGTPVRFLSREAPARSGDGRDH